MSLFIFDYLKESLLCFAALFTIILGLKTSLRKFKAKPSSLNVLFVLERERTFVNLIVSDSRPLQLDQLGFHLLMSVTNSFYKLLQ